MWKTKLCINLFPNMNISTKEQLFLLKQIGFDGFFIEWQPGVNVSEIRSGAEEAGMLFQSIHARWGMTADMWADGPKAEEGIAELCACLEDCAKVQVPIMVCHCYIGFDYAEPTAIGIENYGRVVRRAKELGVKIAFENCEQEQFLAALMDAFKNEAHVGFCWDTGHELCYNHGQDMMALYGDRLLCTHINDNLGIRDFDGKITWIDDLHLLPFDGIADWEGIVSRLNKHNYNDVLTFELNLSSKPDRYENDMYRDMEQKLYLTEAYKRACRVAALKNRKA